MLGWEIMVYRLRTDPAGKVVEDRIAYWMTSVNGIDWLDELVRAGKAQDLGGNGYPLRFSAPAGVVLPIIGAGLPANTSPPVIGDDYAYPRGWSGEVNLDRSKITDCPDDEQLSIEAWDQS